MTDLDAPDNPDSLYLARGDVSLALPVMQGDIYERVTVPGLSEAPLTVAIVMHPCSLRAGSMLRPKITVAAVRPYQRLSDGEWRTGHVNVMPLPHLHDTDDCYAADFRDVAAVPSTALTRTNRIAACSRQGILLLQQRFRLPLDPARGAACEPARGFARHLHRDGAADRLGRSCAR